MVSAATSVCDAELVSPFVRSVKSVFSTMLNSQCIPGEMLPVGSHEHLHGVTAVIGLSGGITGAISLSTSVEGAMQILERMTGMPATEVDELVRDAVGEMANMVGGKGKRDLAQYELLLGLPQVIVGNDYAVFSPRWAKHYWIPFTTDIGPCTLEVGFDSHGTRR